MSKGDAYYRDDYGARRGKKPRRNLALWLTDALMTLLTVVVGTAMALTFFVPAARPEHLRLFPVLGLAAPAIYLATFILALYWIIRWQRVRALVMLALTVIGLFNISLFYRPEIRRDYGTDTLANNAGTFKVMTYNVRGLAKPEGGDMTDSVLQLVLRQDPDIACLQEFASKKAEAAAGFEALKQKYTFVLPNGQRLSDSLHGKYEMTILSKFPVLRSGTALTAASAIWADVLIGDDTVRILNNHLHSTAIKAEDDDYLNRYEYISDTARDVKLRSMVGRVRDNSVLRAVQADTIAAFMQPWRKCCIVCGDFNDTPVSYVYHTVSAGLDDAFRKAGRGYSHTYRGFFNMLRIDYILTSERFEALSYQVLPVDYSDHMPVVVGLKRAE